MADEVRRPARGETSDYYFKYIYLVPEGDIRDILRGQRGEAVAFLRRISEDRAAYRYAPDKWTIAEVVGHINDTERVFMMRAFWFARGHESHLPSYESDAVVKISRAGERSLGGLVDEFDAIRASTAAFFENLPDDGWGRAGIASEMPFTVRALAYIAAGHVIHHVDILKSRYDCR